MLEDQGWIIHRIWSTDWFQRSENELRRCVAAIEKAKDVWSQRDQSLIQSNSHEGSEVAEASLQRENTRSNNEPEETPTVPEYQEADFTVPVNLEPHEIQPGNMADIVIKIVDVEGPIHVSEVARRVANLWGLQRTGNRIVAAVKKGISNAVKRGAIRREVDFLSPVDNREIVVRDRSNVISSTLRKPEMLPPQEIRTALLAVIGASLGVGRDEGIIQVSRLLGFRATSEQLRKTIDHQISELITQSALHESAQGLQVE